MGEASPQIVERLALLGIRPERGRQPVASHIAVVMQNQQRQQPEVFAIAQRRQWLPVDLRFVSSKELQRQGKRGGVVWKHDQSRVSSDMRKTQSGPAWGAAMAKRVSIFRMYSRNSCQRDTLSDTPA